MKISYSVLLLSLSLFSCKKETSPWPPAMYDKPTTVITEGNITTSYPSNWNVEFLQLENSARIGTTRKSIPTKRISFYANEPGYTGFVVGVSIEREQILAQSFPEFQKEFVEEVKKDKADTFIRHIRGNNSFDIIYRSKNRGHDFSYQDWHRFIRVNDSIVYNLHYGSTDKDFETFLPEAYHIIQNFQINETLTFSNQPENRQNGNTH